MKTMGRYVNFIRNAGEVMSMLSVAANKISGPNEMHLKMAGEWLLKAQAASGSEGYAHSYSLFDGWHAAYPETTGYIVPSLLALWKHSGDTRYRESAMSAGKWLLKIQEPDGSFLDLSGKKAVFDTGQIIGGFLALYHETQEERYLTAATKAGDFLVAEQDPDGKWSKFSYNDIPHSYYSKVSANLLELYKTCGKSIYRGHAASNVNWVIAQQADNGYFSRMAFGEKDHPYLHTISYTLEGLLEGFRVLGDRNVFMRVKKAVDALVSSGGGLLWAQYDERWRPIKNERCLTGLAQWSKLLIDLYSIEGTHDYLENAVNTLQYVKSKQLLNGGENIKGAIPGSVPVWGSYFGFAFNNWTVKFYIDALLSLEKVLLKREGR